MELAGVELVRTVDVEPPDMGLAGAAAGETAGETVEFELAEDAVSLDLEEVSLSQAISSGTRSARRRIENVFTEDSLAKDKGPQNRSLRRGRAKARAGNLILFISMVGDSPEENPKRSWQSLLLS
jgi:hypothetical protein